MFSFVKGEPEGRDAKRWLDEASKLGLACAIEVHGDDESAYHDVVAVVRMAAATLWRARRGKGRLRWHELRVSTLVAQMEELGFSDPMIESWMRDLFCFFTFLRVHGRISPDRSLVVQQRMWPWVSQSFQHFYQEAFGIPAHAVSSVYAMNEIALALQGGMAVGTA